MDTYSNHLAAVNTTNGVYSTEDIHNAQGQLLLKSGSQIDAAARDKIIKFKLLKPIEQSVAINNSLDEKKLFEDLEALTNGDQAIAELRNFSDFTPHMKECCSIFCCFPMLVQKLTVMSLQLRASYERSLFSAWVSFIIHLENGYEKHQIIDSFIAALCQDIGLLHIDPDVAQTTDHKDIKEIQQFISHPVIGYNILVNVPELPTTVPRAVLEHHESLDGTGFPRGKIGKQLCWAGQVLNLLDCTWTLYIKHFKPRGRTLADLMPIIQMNTSSRFGNAANALLQILKNGRVTDDCSIPFHLMHDFINHIKDKHNEITSFIKIARNLISKIGVRHDDAKLFAIQNILLHIHTAMTQSGLINEAYMRWLDMVDSEVLVHAYRETEDAYLMINEILSQIEHFKIKVRLYLEERSENEVTRTLKEILEDINQVTSRVPSDQLNQLWITQLTG